MRRLLSLGILIDGWHAQIENIQNCHSHSFVGRGQVVEEDAAHAGDVEELLQLLG